MWKRFAKRCGAAALEVSRFNVGEKPAAFCLRCFSVGGVLLPLAMVVASLRFTNAWLIGAAYRRKAGEHPFRD